ncbi:MAG: beta-lactamase family protein [Streptosporangiaceae bacterium]|nr:beta-lactamase family protein [Streptosporangiaceae bacterium]
MVDVPDVEFQVADYHKRGGQPGLAYGIVVGGELAHAGGFGERSLGGPPPDAGTVFRIASMTKSFTAAAILALRDDGALRLDDQAEAYLPELRGWPPATPDSPRLSLRHLLTMTAGFPTDDPWGDRQQGLPPDEFSAFLSGGVSFAWAPGTRFEYSNLGYALLGRVITAVTGAAYPDYIRDRLLHPLGMTGTGFAAAEFGAADLARGYRRAPMTGDRPGGPGGGEPPVRAGAGGGWSEVPFDPCGAFAPMGGIFSCVRDLAMWVDGFAAAFPPGAPAAGRPHPLRRATRREMQVSQVLTGWDSPDGFPGDGVAAPSAYGYGLFVQEHPALGRVVSHSGGYPGFGSNMCWHPATGTGVIALANGTYAAMGPLAARLLQAVVRQGGRPADGHGVPLAPAQAPWPQTVAARGAVTRLLRSWDDAEAARLFSPNVAQDAPFAERRRVIALIRERIGDFADDQTRRPEFDTPAQCRWWLKGEAGSVQAQIQLTPERPPRVMSLTLPLPPAAGSPLRDTLDALVEWLNGPGHQWPADVPAAPGTDAALLARRLRMAAVWAGGCRLGAVKAGDGAASVAVELAGEYATLTLSLVIDPSTGQVRQAGVAP